MHVNKETHKHMAKQSIKKIKNFLVAIMAMQTSIWLVTWLKCTENGPWPHVISDSGIRYMAGFPRYSHIIMSSYICLHVCIYMYVIGQGALIIYYLHENYFSEYQLSYIVHVHCLEGRKMHSVRIGQNCRALNTCKLGWPICVNCHMFGRPRAAKHATEPQAKQEARWLFFDIHTCW